MKTGSESIRKENSYTTPVVIHKMHAAPEKNHAFGIVLFINRYVPHSRKILLVNAETWVPITNNGDL